MIIDTNQIITMTDANQNFSKASKTAEKYGEAIIIKNNKPRYLLVDLNNENYIFTCLDYNLNHNWKFLDALTTIEKQKTEFLVNPICMPGCP